MTSPLTDEGTMETVMKNIYTSCDPDNSNLVPVSKIIDFIAPYMLEDLSALESLKCALDPQNNNVYISSEQFYEIMNEWTKKIGNSSEEDNDFNRTPSQLDVIDEKQLPYTQSTPRASFGQKLLSCEGLLNLSNVSSYSLSTSTQMRDNNTDISLVGAERTILEEEIKRLEHHLSKLTNEMVMVRLQLTATEEQNDILQADLDRCKTRLHSEQQIIEHLQHDKRYNDELREELNSSKKQIEELTKKMLQYEKDNHHLYNLIEQTEKENSNLENRCEELSRREQEAKKEIIDIKTELDLKDQEMTTIIKINDEMKIKVNKQKDLIDQLTNENELLNHKKNTLEKAMRENLTARRDSMVSQYKTCLADSSSFPNLDQSSEEDCYFKIQEADYKSFLCDSLHTEISQVSLEKDKHSHISSFENNEKQITLVDNNQNLNDNLAIYEKEINQLKVEDNNMRANLDAINRDNEQLQSKLKEMNNKILILEKDVDNLTMEIKGKEEVLKRIQHEKDYVEKDLKALNVNMSQLKDANNNLLENNQILNNKLESKTKLVYDLQEKLLALNHEITNLQVENISKEKELCEFKNKFNFEIAFKNLQMELNEKNVEISEMKKSNEDLRDLLSKITNSNQDLQKSLKETKFNLKEYQEKSKQMFMLNENIEHTASQVQLHIDKKNSMISELVELNKKFELNISGLQEELQLKIKEVTDLRDCLKSDMEIKNIMWRDNKELYLKLDAQYAANKELIDELETIKAANKNGLEECNNILNKYNEEVENNRKLYDQLSMHKGELSSAVAKYDEELIKNHKFSEQIFYLTKEIDSLKVNEGKYYEELKQKLYDYENTNKKLETALDEIKTENEKLKEALEVEKKSKREKFFDNDITPSDVNKNRSFDKQKLSIDRLKEKLEHTTLQLKNERFKCEKLRSEIHEKNCLEDKYTNIQLDFEKTQIKNILEQQALQNIITNLSNTIKKQEEDYKKLEQLSNEKENILSLQISQLEQQNKHVFAELTSKDILINNIAFENETNKNILANVDRKSHEYSTKISACMFQISERDKKIHSLYTEITEKNNNITSLTSQMADLETMLSNANKELTEKATLNINLEKQNKSLQEMLSKSDDHKEKELLDIEQKLQSTSRLLQCSAMELNLIQKKVSDAKQEFDFISEEISKHKDHILSAREELSRVSSLALNKWEKNLEEDDTYQHLLKMKRHEHAEESDVLLLLSNEIKFVVYFVEILAHKAPKPMEDPDCSINSLTNTGNSIPFDSKNIKKFTLRPPRLVISRPASPDSPSLDIEDDNLVNVQVENLNTSTKHVINESADGNNYQDVASCNNEDSFRTANEELSFSQFQGHFELVIEDGFPNISDTFLEKLGLHESSPKQILSKEETERLFTTFAIQIALDSKDIKERLRHRKEQCTEEYERFASMLRDITSRLRDHKCIGAADSINAVFVLLEDLKFSLKDITQSIGQFGILTCENRMMRCWNLVTNYMALLKQEGIKLELEQTIEYHIKDGTLGKNLRRRPRSINEKMEQLCDRSLVPKQKLKDRVCRYKYVPSGKITIAVIASLMFFILMVVILGHWQCRLSVSENQVCVLDDFIKKIQVGNPPY